MFAHIRHPLPITTDVLVTALAAALAIVLTPSAPWLVLFAAGAA